MIIFLIKPPFALKALLIALLLLILIPPLFSVRRVPCDVQAALFCKQTVTPPR